MPPEFFTNSSGTSQVTNLAGKAPMTSAPPVLPMTQIPQYSTTTTARPVTGNFQMLTFEMPNVVDTVFRHVPEDQIGRRSNGN